MNKTELVAAVAEKSGLSKDAAKKAVDAVVESITEALQAKDKVALIGFGTFEAVKKEARQARNPRTGETIKIKASYQPKFKAGSGLKEAVNTKATKKK